MNTKQNHNATPRGFAKLLARGIRANFAPENQKAEIDQLAEFFHDMAMSRDMDGGLPQCNPLEARLATSDAAWLEAIAGELEEMAFQMK
jgi:hypothetical protein